MHQSCTDLLRAHGCLWLSRATYDVQEREAGSRLFAFEVVMKLTDNLVMTNLGKSREFKFFVNTYENPYVDKCLNGYICPLFLHKIEWPLQTKSLDRTMMSLNNN